MASNKVQAEVDADRLLVLVEARTVIYDMTMRDHHNLDILNQAWQEIAEELNASGIE